MRIPQLQSQVSEAQTPSVRIQGGISPGEAVQMANNQSKDLLAVADTYMQYQDQTDRVRVMDAQNKLAELKLRLQTDQKDGYANKKGVDVVGFDDGEGGNFIDYYQRQYADGIGQISSTLSNDRQRKMFGELAQKESTQFKGGLQSYFLRENDNYQQSVYSASADRYVMNINENPADFNVIDENRDNLRAAINQSTKLDGKSAIESENVYLKTISKAHVSNLSSFVESGDLRAAVQYKKKYQDEISLADGFKVESRIKQLLEDKQVEYLVNQVTSGTQENSNPALNAPPAVSQKVAEEISSLSLDQMKKIKYNDQRLDVYTVHAAKQKNMEWAAPIALGLRLAGEKSNNDQTSPKGAKSVMQFIPATWNEYNKNGQRDINNPVHTIDASLEFIDWISKKYKTKDPMVIAAYYNGGGKAAEAVLKGQQPPATETQKYLQRMDNWLSNGLGKYGQQPQNTRQEAYDAVWSSGAPLEVKEKAQSAIDKKFAAEDRAKKEQQNTVYDQAYKSIASGKTTYEQLPVNLVNALAPNQIASLRAFSKSVYTDVKTDPVTFSMISLNREELFKDKPQSVLHQYADKLSPNDYREVTKMYAEVNKIETSKPQKEKTYIVNDSNVALAIKPYLNTIGITDTKNKEQLLHYNAVKTDLVQTLREAEAKNGGSLTWQQINRLVLKNINTNIKTTFSPLIGKDTIETNRLYAEVKKKSDISQKNLDRINEIFKQQGRNPNKVTDSEYINAFYSMMRRGF